MTGNVELGFLCALIAPILFGTNFIPVKRYETYDGMYYQWVMCVSIWMTGLALQMLLFAAPPEQDGHWVHGKWNATAESGRVDAYSLRFMPFAALGGFLWATGNVLSVPVINLIGLGLGQLIWGSSNMVRARKKNDTQNQ